MSWPPGAHASTFGGNPVACAAATTTIRLLKEQLVANAAAVGEHLMDGIRELQSKHAIIGDVRGKGLMIGIELVRDRQTKERAVEERNALVQAVFRRGVLVLGAGKNAIRLAPPLVFTTAIRPTACSACSTPRSTEVGARLSRLHRLEVRACSGQPLRVPIQLSCSSSACLPRLGCGSQFAARSLDDRRAPGLWKNRRRTRRSPSSSAAGTQFLRAATAPNMAKSTSSRATARRPCSSRSRRGRPRSSGPRRRR